MIGLRPLSQQRLEQRRDSPTTTHPPVVASCYTVGQLAAIVTSLCIVIVILLAALAATCVHYRRRLRRTRKPLSRSSSSAEQWQRPKDPISIEIEESIERLNLPIAYTPREINSTSINLLTEVGVGKFGKVYKAALDESQDRNIPAYIVAVKIHTAETTASQRAEFFHESAVMAQLNHVNIVRLVGQVVRGDNLMLIEQYMEYGSLGSWLTHHGEDTAVFVLLNMAGDVAEGMYYLSSKGFIHRDLAARNILVGSDFQCKVSDFGLTQRMNSEGVYVSHVTQIAVRWTAIEALEENIFSTASDMWSFAVVLHEIFTFGQKPYDNAWTNHRVYHEVMNGFRLEQQRLCPDVIYTDMLLAWDVNPAKRPKFDEFALSLRNASSATAFLTSSKLSFSRLKTPMAEPLPDNHLQPTDTDTNFDADGNFIAAWSFENTEGIRINVHDASDDGRSDDLEDAFKERFDISRLDDATSQLATLPTEVNTPIVIKVSEPQESHDFTTEPPRPASPASPKEFTATGPRTRSGRTLVISDAPVSSSSADRSVSPANRLRKQASQTSINGNQYTDLASLQQATTATPPRRQHKHAESRSSLFVDNMPSRERIGLSKEDEKWTAKFLVLQGSANPNSVVAEAMESVLRRQSHFGLGSRGSMMNLHLEDIPTGTRPTNHDYTVLIGADGFGIDVDDDLAAPSLVYSTTAQPSDHVDDSDGSHRPDSESNE